MKDKYLLYNAQYLDQESWGAGLPARTLQLSWAAEPSLTTRADSGETAITGSTRILTECVISVGL